MSLNAAIKIVEAKDGTRLEPNHAYIAPEGCCVEVENYTVKLTHPSEKFGCKTVIDDLFRSLAKSRGPQSACVVLSGSGSDGTAGLRALKAAGGLAIVQSPKTADYAAMPVSVINANAADRVLPIEEIPPLLYRFANRPPIELEGSQTSSGLRTVAALLKTRENFDLNQYKDSTVQRRICRRMCLTNQHNLDHYVALLREQEKERQYLMHDLLINVTDFFRDRDAFKELEGLAVNDIVQRAETGSTIRVWICGCASGEEAYSIAILFLENIELFGRELELRVFATDVDEEAISIARQGIYPMSVVSELPVYYITKYFMPMNENYFVVQPHLRDCISFATQNVCSDPPFSRIDLVSCRNLLIYLRREAQEQAFKSFYFALKTHGYLFLGNSESAGSQQTMFKTLSQKGRIYVKNENGLSHSFRPRSPNFDYIRSRHARRLESGTQTGTPSSAVSAREAILKTVGPSVLIDTDNRVVYTHGKVNGFMHIPEGEARLDFIRMVDPELRTRLRSGIFKARKSDSKIVIHSPRSFLDRQFKLPPLEITIYPVHEDSLEEGAVLIRFEEQPGNEEVAREQNLSTNDQETMIEAIECELKETRQELQNTVEELETNTEELKSAHEEALSTNEELQSANEELEASTEELRSLNEELTTVNTQLKEKIFELQVAHNDIENFFESTNLATLFLDSNLRIKRYTPAAERLLDLSADDVGRSINDINRLLIDEETSTEAKKVLESFETIEKEIKTENNTWHQRKILPYRTAERRIDGVVVTFNDITALKQTATQLATREKQHALVAKLGIEALSSEDIHEFMSQIVREVVHILEADMCKIVQYRPKTNDFMLVAGTGWNENIQDCKTVVPADLDSQSGFALRERGAVIVEDLRDEKRFNGPKLLLDHGVISGVSCIIENRGHPWGVIGVHTKTKHIYTSDDANFLCSVANLLSIVVQRVKSERKLRDSEERLKLAREAANIGIHDHDLKSNVLKWDDRVYEIMGVDSGTPVTLQLLEQCIHPEDRKPVTAAIDNLAKNPKNPGVKLEYRIINQKDNNVRWLEASAKTFYINGEAVRIVGTVQDVTQRKNVEISLFESEQKLRIAKNSNKFGAYVHHIESGQLEWDLLLKEIWGYDQNDKLDIEAFYSGIHPDDVNRVRHSVEVSMNAGHEGHIRNVFRVVNRKNRDLKWVEASGQVIFDKDAPTKMIGMIIDITDSKKLEESLQVAVEKLARENARKNEFIATLGHELRNPLAAVNSGLQIMQLGTGDSQWALNMMSNNIKLICSLLDDLLDLTRISLGRIQLKKTSVDLNQLIHATQEMFLSSATEKQIKLVHSMEKGSNDVIYVYGDQTRLEQVFGNIISNALKFTPRGGTVNVTVTSQQDNVQIEIEDTGIGIPPDKLAVVFEPFEQISHGAVHNPGLGIGLSLVQRFVEMHGGSARAESAGKGKGSRFIVTLPIHKQKRQENKAYHPPTLKEQLKVLIVDDNEDAARGLEAMLHMQGCHVATAYTAKSTLEKLDNFEPEVFILDIGLPDMNGYDLLQELKNIYNREALYIALTGFTQSKSDAHLRSAQFDYYHTKPADFNELLQILGTVE